MNNDEYNKFLTAACDVVGAMADYNLEMTDGAEGISLDDESRLMLCVSSPNKFDEIDEIVSNFNACYAYVSKKEKAT